MAKDDKPKSPSLTEKTLSLRIPDDKHKTLKARCVIEDITMRALLLALIAELENDTPAGRKLIKAAADLDSQQ